MEAKILNFKPKAKSEPVDGACAASTPNLNNSECAVANMASVRDEKQKELLLAEQARNVKKLSEAVLTAVGDALTDKNNNIEYHQIAALFAHISRDLVFSSFERIEPTEKAAKRTFLQQHLASIILRPSGVNAPKPVDKMNVIKKITY